MTALILMLALAMQEDFGKKLDEILPRLASERIAEREVAVADLFKQVDSAGPNARAILRTRLKTATDPSVRLALEAALKRIPPLELKIEVKGEPAVGWMVKFKARIKNIGDDEVAVVRSLDGSAHGSRYPRVFAEIRGPDGHVIPRESPFRCGHFNRLRIDDLSALKPGQDFDPFGQGSYGNFHLSDWYPAVAGKHTVLLWIDYSAKEPAEWRGVLGPPGSEDEPLRRLFDQVPKVKLEAKVEFEVKE